MANLLMFMLLAGTRQHPNNFEFEKLVRSRNGHVALASGVEDQIFGFHVTSNRFVDTLKRRGFSLHKNTTAHEFSRLNFLGYLTIFADLRNFLWNHSCLMRRQQILVFWIMQCCLFNGNIQIMLKTKHIESQNWRSR